MAATMKQLTQRRIKLILNGKNYLVNFIQIKCVSVSSQLHNLKNPDFNNEGKQQWCLSYLFPLMDITNQSGQSKKSQ